MEEYEETIGDIKDLLFSNRLPDAISEMNEFVYAHSSWGCIDEFERLHDVLLKMLEYMRKGYKDNKVQQVYDQLFIDFYSFVLKVERLCVLQGNTLYASTARKLMNFDKSAEDIKAELEDYVTNTALLELETEDKEHNDKLKSLRQKHQSFVSDVFSKLWTSELWSDGLRSDYEELILSPTTDSNDDQLFISAIRWAGMQIFDINKFTLLVNGYKESNDEYIRQRALVGWVFMLYLNDVDMYDSAEILVSNLVNDDNVTKELSELQIQIVYCINAEKDNETIQRDIMPDLLKNKNLNITRFGIEEKEEDPMQDIFDPGADDRAMDELENSIGKISDMQKNGADVYFGGFSHMKSYYFFNTLSNWFCPFYFEHSDLINVIERINKYSSFKNIIDKGPFCDSDKYSFCMAIIDVIEKIPASYSEMLSSDSLFMGDMDNEISHIVDTPPYIRRNYLQSLYRFFKLNRYRNEFNDPFDIKHYLFFAHNIFVDTHLESKYDEVAKFLYKKKLFHDMGDLLTCYSESAYDYNYYMLSGSYYCNCLKVYDTAAEYYKKALDKKPDDKKALVAYARCSANCGSYSDAIDTFGKLMASYPENYYFVVDYCTCLIVKGDYEMAFKFLYKIFYEHPDDIKILRVLAWCSFCDSKLEQAEKYYKQILSNKKVLDVDYLNAGHTSWANRDVVTAIDRYKRYIYLWNKDEKHDNEVTINDALTRDWNYLSKYGLCDAERLLMAELVSLDD